MARLVAKHAQHPLQLFATHVGHSIDRPEARRTLFASAAPILDVKPFGRSRADTQRALGSAGIGFLAKLADET